MAEGFLDQLLVLPNEHGNSTANFGLSLSAKRGRWGDVITLVEQVGMMMMMMMTMMMILSIMVRMYDDDDDDDGQLRPVALGEARAVGGRHHAGPDLST
jgi:riboflavin synthase